MRPNVVKPAMVLLGLLIVGSWIAMALISPGDPSHARIGFVLGTMFGQTTLAAGWTVFGTQRLRWRLVIALAWIFALLLPLAVQTGQRGPHWETLLMFALCLTGQCIVAQIPLWTFAFYLRL